MRLFGCIQYVLIIVISLFMTTANAMTFDQIIIFGDSLSDNGNVYALTQRANRIVPQLPPMPQSPPYYNGRFTNGLVWIEYLADYYHIPLHNYAFGGSWAEPFYDSHTIIPFDLATQVYTYLSETHADNKKDQHLYVIWSGGNDYSRGRKEVDYATTNTVNAIQKQIELLINVGAKHFLILSLPDLSTAPGIVKQGERVSYNVAQLVKLHNQKLIKMIKVEKKSYPDIDFIIFNMTNHMNMVRRDPEHYHMTNIDDPCYQGTYTVDGVHLNDSIRQAASQANIDIVNNISLNMVFLNAQSTNIKKCDNPDEYLYWDNMHPSSKMHQLIAEAVYNSLNKAT